MSTHDTGAQTVAESEELWAWLVGQAKERGDALAIVNAATGALASWSQWKAIIDALMVRLFESGVGPASLVAHLGTNHPATLSLALAAGRLGADFWPVNYRWSPGEIRQAFANFSNRDVVFCAVEGGFGHLFDGNFERELVDRDLLWEQARQASDDEQARAPSRVPADFGRVIMATGGTTARSTPSTGPRLVALEERHLVYNARMFETMTGLDATHVVMVCAPNFHVAGFSALTLAALPAGASLVFAPRFIPSEILATIDTWRVTATVMVPTMWRMLMSAAREAGQTLETLQFGICGGAPMDPSLVDEARALGFELLQGYGMTEAGPMVTLMPPGDQPSSRPERAASAGIAPTPIEVRIVGADGSTLAPGQSGQIVIKGPNLVESYLYGNGSSSFQEGYFFSGDRGYLDEDRYLYVEGRLDEMIISGGENIAPSQVEAVFRRDPSISDIAVLGVPDPHWGERVVAIVVPTDGADRVDWETACERARPRLARYKMPREVRFARSLPLTPAGKLLRPRLLDLWYELPVL